jgi:hypothetical protein
VTRHDDDMPDAQGSNDDTIEILGPEGMRAEVRARALSGFYEGYLQFVRGPRQPSEHSYTFQPGDAVWSSAHPNFHHMHYHTMDRAFDDDRHMEVIDLEACWRCWAPVPRDDDLGLCKMCVQALQDL